MALLALIAGCGGGAATSNSPVVSFPRRSGSLVYTVATNKAVYARGEPVMITFTVRNVGDKQVEVLRGACEFFNTAVSRGGLIVWSKLPHGCADPADDIVLGVGETKTYSYDWIQTDEQGAPVAAGEYTLTSWYEPFSVTDPTLAPGNQETNEAALPIQITVAQ
jgi:hypothetical protein